MEVNAATLVAQLNHLASDLSNSVIICWILWIYLFDFDVKHVLGMKNTVADGLSQQPLMKEDLWEDMYWAHMEFLQQVKHYYR